MGQTASTPSNFVVETQSNGYIVSRPRDPDDVAPIAKRRKQMATDPTDSLEIVTAKSGLASIEPTTITALFQRAAEERANQVALRWETNIGTPEEGFGTLTWSQYYNGCEQVAQAMIASGVEQYDTVSIMGFNSKYWVMSQMGAVMCGAKSAGIYSTNSPADCAYIVNHSKTKIVMVENNDILKRYKEAQDTLKTVTTIVVWNEAPDKSVKFKKVKVLGWDEFLALGTDEKFESALYTRLDKIKPSDGAQLIYTSGTTGSPKAVMCSHDNLWFESKCIGEIELFKYPVWENSMYQHFSVSFLPLSHVAGNMLDVIMPIALSGEPGSKTNCVVTFARPDAMRGSLKHTLVKVRPTVFLTVPRAWEKFREGIMKVSAETPKSAVMQAVIDFAKGKGAAEFEQSIVEANDDGTLQVNPIPFDPLRNVAGALIHTKIQSALGLDRCARCSASAAAPISRETIEWFGQFGIHIHEAYGMSESSGATSCSDHGTRKTLCLGMPLPGCEIMIAHDKNRDKAGEGEICFRGRHIMMGYMHDEVKTAECIDDDGWLHSGDVGRLDAAGRIYITGRIKELIITAGGENIAPVPIEESIKEFGAGVISNCMLVGDCLKYNSVLITLKHVMDGTEPTDEFDMQQLQKKIPDFKATSPKDANKDAALKAYVEDIIKNKYNPKAVSNAQKVQKFIVVPEFSLQGGELTPTLKLKRAVVLKKFDAEVKSMY